MFLLVLVLLLLFSFIEIRLLVWQDRVVVPPGPVGRFQRARLALLGLRPRPLEGLGAPIFGASDIDALSCPEPNLQKSTPRKITTNQKTL
jgi:hypothetical protein